VRSNPIFSKKYIRPAALSVLVWSILHICFIYWLGYDLKIAVADSLTFNFLLADFCLAQMFIMQFYVPKKEQTSYIILVGTIIALAVTFLSEAIIGWYPFGDEDYAAFLNKSLPVRIAVAFLFTAIINMFSMLVSGLEEQKNNTQRRFEAEQLSKEAELYNLRSQLQPHFLFNSLNSISALAGSKPEQARKMIQQLSDFLRGTIKKDESQLIPLKEELHHLNLYLEIEKVRFGHRLETVIFCDDVCQDKKVPSLLLQPILENAIKFGLYDTLENVTIRIDAQFEENNLIIAVTNPFDQSSSPPKKGTGFGLSSVQRRLYLLFSRNDLLQTAQTENQFITTIKIPQPAV
jgi:two-component system, LytTR family, sensor kinase